MTEKHEPTAKAVDRIGPELAKSVKEKQTGLPIVHMKDGKVSCPGCSLEIPVIDPGPGVSWVQMNAACQSCHTEFIVRDQSAGPSQVQDAGETIVIVADADYYLAESQGNVPHIVKLAPDGSGTSSEEDGHSHQVIAWNVQEANAHIHPLVKGTYHKPESTNA